MEKEEAIAGQRRMARPGGGSTRTQLVVPDDSGARRCAALTDCSLCGEAKLLAVGASSALAREETHERAGCGRFGPCTGRGGTGVASFSAPARPPRGVGL